MITYAEIKRFDQTQFGQVRLIATGDVLPVGDQARIIFVDIAGHDPGPLVGWYYDHDGAQFSETLPPGAVVPKATIVASQLWLGRFTSDERADVWAVCNGEAVAGVTIAQRQRYRLAAFRDITLAGEPIPLHSNEAQTVINGLESAGLLAAGRAAEILA